MSITTQAQILAAARALNKRHAQLCNVNEAASWMIQGDDFLADASAALCAAAVAEPADTFALEWRSAPIRTEWGEGMMRASVALSADHTLNLYAEKKALHLVSAALAVPTRGADSGYLQQDGVAAWLDAQHPDDAAVDRFAQAMKLKLKTAREKGRSGWQTCPPAEHSRMLRDHVEKGDPRDVANFCMFLWTVGAGIAADAPDETLCDEIRAVLYTDTVEEGEQRVIKAQAAKLKEQEQRIAALEAVQADTPLSPEAAAALLARLKADPTFALATLQSAGIATADGKLSEQFGGEPTVAPKVQAQSAAAVPAPAWTALPYATPLDLFRAFKKGAKFVLHYHGKAIPVERMSPHDAVCYVQPPALAVKVYPDGRNCESAGDGIWLEQIAAAPVDHLAKGQGEGE